MVWIAGPGAAFLLIADQTAHETFTNPIVARGQDPWVVRWGSKYYYCQSRADGVCVTAATNLEDIGRGNLKRVWHPQEGLPYSREIWAPELHFLRGKWYIYVAADDGNNDHHRMYVLEGTSMDPTRPFVLKSKLATPMSRWAIDGTVLEMPDGRLYFIWSGWEGPDNVAQNLYIAPMSNPWTISGKRVCIARPEYAWEKHGLSINEGPETLWHGKRLFIIFSASAMWMDEYCLGELTWSGGDVLDAKSWEKSPSPVFSSSTNIFGPGHCSFVKSPDGTQDWIVYHAHTHRGSGAVRDVHIQPFSWRADGSPDFGVPIADGIPLSRPAGEQE